MFELERGLDFIYLLQSWKHPVWDLFFSLITWMGNASFYIFLLPLLYWSVNTRLAMRLGLLIMLSGWINFALKAFFSHPRPYVYSPGLDRVHARGYSFPSGHAQLSVGFWGYLAILKQKRWLWNGLTLLLFLIGCSRVYLGVHFPKDVLAGWVVGAAILAVYVMVLPPLEQWFSRQGLRTQIVLIGVVPIAAYMLYPLPKTLPLAGVLMGLGCGHLLSTRFIGFQSSGSLKRRIARYLIGLVVLIPSLGFGLYLNQLCGYLSLLCFAEYALLGFLVTFIIPWIFRLVRIA